MHLPIIHNVGGEDIIYNESRRNHVWNANQCKRYDLIETEITNFGE